MSLLLFYHIDVQALVIITANPKKHVSVATQLLPLLPIIPVKYDIQLVTDACCKLAEACGEADPLGTAVALLVESLYPGDQQDSWMASRDKV